MSAPLNIFSTSCRENLFFLSCKRLEFRKDRSVEIYPMNVHVKRLSCSNRYRYIQWYSMWYFSIFQTAQIFIIEKEKKEDYFNIHYYMYLHYYLYLYYYVASPSFYFHFSLHYNNFSSYLGWTDIPQLIVGLFSVRQFEAIRVSLPPQVDCL